jgi:hypothetical protein
LEGWCKVFRFSILVIAAVLFGLTGMVAMNEAHSEFRLTYMWLGLAVGALTVGHAIPGEIPSRSRGD